MNIVGILGFSALLGVGLAMDAFSVSLANGLHEPGMSKSKMCAVAGIFAFFQAIMPMIGWICVHLFLEHFQSFSKFIPWIALILLAYIGGKMLYDGIKCEGEECELQKTTFGMLLVQGIATSIDALSVGFTISEYSAPQALMCVGVIAALTFAICLVGVKIGKTFGAHLSGRASILGGGILIAIGCYIFVSGVFF
jgi:putative Mn2+ efflux pump MntP